MNNKLWIGIIGLVLIIFLIWKMLFPANSPQVFDPSYTVSKDSYKPYDNKFFYDELKKHARLGFVTSDSAFNYANTKVSFDDSTKILVEVSPYFLPNNQEIVHLKNFVGMGNYAFIAAYSISRQFIDSLFFASNTYRFDHVYPPKLSADSMQVAWISTDSLRKTRYSYSGHTPVLPAFDSISLYGFSPKITEDNTDSLGIKLNPSPLLDSTANSVQDSVENAVDSTTTDEEDDYTPISTTVTKIDTLLVDKNGKPQLLEIHCGKGKIFLTNNPILLSNFFLLHGNNYDFLNKIFNQIDLKNRTVIWDLFYRKFSYQRKDNDEKDSFFLKLVHKYPPLTWAFYTFLGTIALFILIYLRRIQAAVVVLPPIENHSLAFVNVISGLYWQQQNHQSIAEKMVHHFYETLSSQHRIYPKDFQKENTEIIAQKTGKDITLIEDIMSAVRGVETGETSASDLTELYKKLYLFYY